MDAATTPIMKKRMLSDKVSKTPLTPCRRVGLGRPNSGFKKITVQADSLTPRGIESKQSQLPINMKKDYEEQKSYRQLQTERILTNDDSSKKPLSRSLSQRTKRLNAKRVLCDYDLNSSPSMDNQSNNFLSHSLKNASSTPNIKMSCSQKNCTKKQKINFDQTLNIAESESISICNLPRLHFNKENNDLKPTSNNGDVTFEMIQKLVSSIREKKKKLELLTVQKSYSKKHDLEDLRAQTRKWRLAGQDALRYSVSLAKKADFSVTIKQLIDDHGFSDDLIQYNEDDDEFL